MLFLGVITHVSFKEHDMTHVTVYFIFARVTYLSRRGFQWFRSGQNLNQNTVKNNMSPDIMWF